MMKLFQNLMIVSLIFICFGSTAAYAQKELKKTFSLSEDQTFNLPPAKDIPKRHIQEMQKVYYDCVNDTFEYGHKDCKCYAMAYLQERLKFPTVEREIVETAVEGICYDPKKMNDYYFQQCVNNMDLRLIGPKKDPVALCECFGRFMASKIPSMRSMSSNGIQYLSTDAYMSCGFKE